MDKIPKFQKEGFSGQRLLRMPHSVLCRMKKMPFVRDFMITDIGCYPCAPYHRVERLKGAEGDIFLFIEKGHGWVRMDKKTFRVAPREAVWIPAGKPHAYGADLKQPWGIHWIHAKGEGLTGLLQWLPFRRSRPIAPCPRMDTMIRYCQAILDRLENGYTDTTLLESANHLISILCTFHRNIVGGDQDCTHAEKSILQSMEKMQIHFDKDYDLSFYARGAGYSISQYMTHFRTHTGSSPMRYLRELRMQRACEQLDTTSESIRIIAARIGYPDPLHFSRLFRQTTGLSPSAYRKRVKG